MRVVFGLFPDLAHAPSKTIEIHPRRLGRAPAGRAGGV